MSQLRKDPIVSRWTIIATERARRPAAFVDPQSTRTDPQECPYCQDKETKTIHELNGVRDQDKKGALPFTLITLHDVLDPGSIMARLALV